MGARASFAIIENGRTTLYYSHWGADSLVRSVFFGPSPTIETVRSDREVEWLLHEVPAEGGILLDLDAKRLIFYQSHLPFHPELRQVLLPLMQTNWPGWELRWAHGEMVQIADLIGYDSHTLRDPMNETDSWFRPPGLVDPPNYLQSWLTIGSGPEARDLAFDDSTSNLLAMGPALFEAVQHRPTADPKDREKLADLEEGAHLDRSKREISLWETVGCHLERSLDIIQSRWPGWAIGIHHDGLPGHWTRSGRDPIEVSVGEAGILNQITALVLDDSTFDPQRFLDHLAASGEEIERISPDFLNVPRNPIDADDRATLLAQSIAEFRRLRLAGGPT